MKHGYNSVKEFKAGVQKKFSLLENGILNKPSTRLLLINVSLSRPLHNSYLHFHVCQETRLTDNTQNRVPKMV